MAVIKDIENVYGAEFNYHKIKSVTLNSINGNIVLKIVVASWINKEARLNGKNPVLTENIINNADFAMNPFYSLLKAKFKSYENSDDDWERLSPSARGKSSYTQLTPAGQIISQYTEETGE